MSLEHLPNYLRNLDLLLAAAIQTGEKNVEIVELLLEYLGPVLLHVREKGHHPVYRMRDKTVCLTIEMSGDAYPALTQALKDNEGKCEFTYDMELPINVKALYRWGERHQRVVNIVSGSGDIDELYCCSGVTLTISQS